MLIKKDDAFSLGKIVTDSKSKDELKKVLSFLSVRRYINITVITEHYIESIHKNLKYIKMELTYKNQNEKITSILQSQFLNDELLFILYNSLSE